ncbi:hypothetical protein [Yinghuangia seranimata]|uniref:hypothetical protein n=1 Tax=Yinghuangia seranimata TaxID=408067 RepID=UPI00248B7454|nr:hypothetical protein [Yinghuangia seranimata]MDI2131169.1 hypothetical protein [Yinghuangia seranimata]
MNTAVRVGAFGAGITLAFGAALGIGHAVGPVGTGSAPAHAGHPGGDHGTPAPSDQHGTSKENGDMNGSTHTGHGGTPNGQAADGSTAPGGLQVSERGYTLAVSADPIPAGVPTDFRFRVLGPDGAPWTKFDRSHDKELHLIVARRDLSGFQHVHPVLGADGTWSVPLTFAEAGAYRVFADFAPTGDPAGPLTLGADVAVAGDFRPTPLPEASRTATVDGYTVTLDGDLSAGSATMLTLSVSRDGKPVTDLQPYLAAYGHLVALRQGDLGYLHVHPQGEPGDGVTPAGPGIGFHTQAPSAGTYRLYLDFQHNGVVRTAEFTVVVGVPATAPAAPAADHPGAPAPATTAPSEGGGHHH